MRLGAWLDLTCNYFFPNCLSSCSYAVIYYPDTLKIPLPGQENEKGRAIFSVVGKHPHVIPTHIYFADFKQLDLEMGTKCGWSHKKSEPLWGDFYQYVMTHGSCDVNIACKNTEWNILNPLECGLPFF